MQGEHARRMRRLRRQHGPVAPPGAAPPRRDAERASPAREAAERAARNAWIYGRHPVEAVLANPARRLRRAIAVAEVQPWLAERLAAARAQRADAVAA